MIDKLRPIAPLPLADVTPAAYIGRPPRVELVSPTDLYVEDAYQRDLSPKSIRLIRSMVEGWDWRSFKAPNCATIDGVAKYAVTDGQHTAIAAATLLIPKFPVLITEGGEVSDRARAFIGINKLRLNVTPLQLHHAAVAAGDEIAVAVDECLRMAEATLVASKKQPDDWRPGDTMALSAIQQLVTSRGRGGGVRVLRILRRARITPIPSALIQAVAMVIWAPEWAVKDDAAIANALAARSGDAWLKVGQDGRANGVPVARAIAVALYRAVSGSR